MAPFTPHALRKVVEAAKHFPPMVILTYSPRQPEVQAWGTGKDLIWTSRSAVLRLSRHRKLIECCVKMWLH